MSDSVTVEQQVHFVRGNKGRKHLKSGGQTETPQRIPRIARLMALAIHFDELIRTGKVIDQSELARLGRVSTARISQIMGLLYLAPEIQERLLFFEFQSIGRIPTERYLRQHISPKCWSSQILQIKVTHEEFKGAQLKGRNQGDHHLVPTICY